MNKPEPQTNDGAAALPGANQAETGLTPETIRDMMNRAEYDAEQLPALWQQVTELDDGSGTREQAWRLGIAAMYRRCETYPQHTKLTAVLSGVPVWARHYTSKAATQARNLLRQATPIELQQALICGQQHSESWWQHTSNQILEWGAIEQLTGQTLKQAEWNGWLTSWAATPRNRTGARDRWRHISETIQQELLDGDSNAWNMFLEIVEPGHSIGETAELAKTIEQQNRPVRQTT